MTATLQLDARQRRMLACMGIDTQWLPQTVASVPVAPAAPRAEQLVSAQPGIDSMDPAMRRKPLRELQQIYQAQVGQEADMATVAARPVQAPELAPAPPFAAAPDVAGLCLRFFNAQGQAQDAAQSGACLLLLEPSGVGDGPPVSADALALLANILRAAQLPPEAVQLAALPAAAEEGAAAACVAQLQAAQPALLLLLGRKACAWLLGQERAVGQLRGQTHDWQGHPALASYPLDYLLRNPEAKLRAWEDWFAASRVLAQREKA